MEYRGQLRWTVSQVSRVEILDRLLEENHRRASLDLTAKDRGAEGRKGVKHPVQEEGLF